MHSFDGPTLEIDLSRLVANYALLRARFTGAECAAVVKANAYGLGVDAVAPALADAGCQSFFVATLQEAIQLRSLVPDRKIAVFHGVGEGEELAFINHQLIPILNSPQQIARWQKVADTQEDRPAILHLDTGMARLGLTHAELLALPEDTPERCQLSLIMSHLACSSDMEHPQNHAQLDQFIRAAERFPELPTSLCNSGGIFLGEAFHDDLARPGCALYGIHPGDAADSPMQPVVRLSAPIIQIRALDDEQPVGYGASQTLPKGAKLATVALGYADGIHRHLSHKLCGYIGGIKVPLVGRVTMDLLTFDISALTDEAMQKATRIEMMNEAQTVNDIAVAANTIGYEVLTSLGARVRREYTEWAK
jgi:alanine racemase